MNTAFRLLSALMLVSLGFCATAARADDKPVKLTRQWKGSVADAALANDSPTFIATPKEFDQLWTKWKLADKPAIDFSKEIVVLATTPGSHLALSCTLGDGGNLKVIGMATLDFGEGFRYVIGTVSREGVKTVEGKELPKE